MIVLFTDFGVGSPYLGQVKAVLHQEAPGVPIVDLCADAPAYDAQGSAYLLAALLWPFPAGSVFLGVVDPGVGSARRALAVRADGRWFVGPDNGLFSITARRAVDVRWWEVIWRPARLSATFHGRDLFAPVAARLAHGDEPTTMLRQAPASTDPGWPEDLARIIYIDHYGNAMSGMYASALAAKTVLRIRDHRLARARTFSDTAPGTAFWYENSNGLVEVAVNQGSAARELDIRIGEPLQVEV